MAYKYFDFECPNCGNVEERMHQDGDVELCEEWLDVDGGGLGEPWRVETNGVAEVRQQCHHEMVKLMSAPLPKTIVKGNSDYSERERERLTKRSNDHWKRAGRHEAADRQKMQMKKIEKALG